MSKNFVDYYSVLDVGQQATKKQIKTTFYKRNRRFEGNKNSKEWRTIYKAFTVLSNDEKRVIYDRSYHDNKNKKQNMVVVIPDQRRKKFNRNRQLKDTHRPMDRSSYNNSDNFYINQYGEVINNELMYDELGLGSMAFWGWDGYDPDFDDDLKNKQPRGKKSNIWKYFRNLGLICVEFAGGYCLTFALENDSATVWTVFGRCLCGVGIIFICWGCVKVIYTIGKWIVLRLYDLGALICKTLYFITETALVLNFYCVAIVIIAPFVVMYTIYWSALKIYYLGALICKKLLYMPDKKVSTYYPPLVKGSLIILSMGCVGWGLSKLFR